MQKYKIKIAITNDALYFLGTFTVPFIRRIIRFLSRPEASRPGIFVIIVIFLFILFFCPEELNVALITLVAPAFITSSDSTAVHPQEAETL